MSTADAKTDQPDVLGYTTEELAAERSPQRKAERRAELSALGARIRDGERARLERDALIGELNRTGWTQVELAEAIGVTQAGISKIVNTPAGPRYLRSPELQDMWYLIGRAFGVGRFVESRLFLIDSCHSEGERLHRVWAKYYLEPTSEARYQQLRAAIDHAVTVLRRTHPEQARRAVATLGEIDEWLTPPSSKTLLRPSLDQKKQFTFGDQHQYAALAKK